MGAKGTIFAHWRKKRRSSILVIMLAGIIAVYFSLPRSWFEIPEDEPAVESSQNTAPEGSPPAAPTIEELRDAAQGAPLDHGARSRYGIALVAAGKVSEAETEFKAARTLAPEMPTSHHNLGILYLNAGKLDLADISFCRELELAPGDPRAHYYRGLVAQRRLKTEDAIAQFRYVIAIAPNYSDAYLALAIQATRKEPEEQIRGYVDRFIALTGKKGLANYVLSGAYRTWGRHAEAAHYAEISVEVDPENYAYWHNLGQIYSYAKRTQDAERALGKALTLARDPTTVLIELGMNARTARRFPEAIDYFNRALLASPRTGNIHSYLSGTYRMMGDEAASDREMGAFRKWERAMRTTRPTGGADPPKGRKSS